MRKIFSLSLLIFPLLFMVLSALFFSYLKEWYEKPVFLKNKVVLNFPRGTSLSLLSKKLYRKGLISNTLNFSLAVRFFSNYKLFQAGRYRFIGKISPRQIVDMFVKGKVFWEVALEFTVPEGFTMKQIAKLLEEKGVAPAKQILALAANKEFLKSLGVKAPTLEGYLFPATYRFYK
ncbi:MAG: hypothetical protein D6780_07170 [Candidatus Dadabacteria bacterium]|nr:MAG: hypothetical protein D6780_07170 [Candidatus Dadabacteria bacterium]